jgi:uncharacterized membrane protein
VKFFGHFHPVLVHLPIGIILIGLFMEWLARKEKYASIKPAINVVLFAGAFTAILACISGYLLSLEDEYDTETLNLHKWLGISVALLASLAYGIRKEYFFYSHSKRIYPVSAILLFVLIVTTGHFGGTLTHGSGYLTQNLPNVFEVEPEETHKIITNVQEAILYEDIIAPILQNKCYTCHGPKKQKGGLRLDQPDLIIKGGKDGKVLRPGEPEKSDMMERLLLPPEDKDHMPPKERKQLSEAEIKLIHWWIEQGADFTKKVKDYGSSDSIRPLFASLQIQDERKNIPNDEVPNVAVPPADNKLLDSIRSKGILALPVAKENNYLLASFINASDPADSTIRLLEGLQQQLLFLKMGGAKVGDSALISVGKLFNLVRLNLEYTSISDTGLKFLGNLNNLQYINLVGTRVTAKGIIQLNGLKKLKTIYLFKTSIQPQDWDIIKRALPQVLIDTGGYIVPTLASDTIVVKPPEDKKKKKKEKKEEKKDEKKDEE